MRSDCFWHRLVLWHESTIRVRSTAPAPPPVSRLVTGLPLTMQRRCLGSFEQRARRGHSAFSSLGKYSLSLRPPWDLRLGSRRRLALMDLAWWFHLFDR